ncbi:MAG: RodZ domain-containing protein [Pseudomonadota bacterium]
MIGHGAPPKSAFARNPKGFDDFDLKLGDVMRGERATMGKSLLDVQRELKIKANYIAAIENADLSAFETPGFIAGYVRSYARYLGMHPDRTFETFCEESNFSGIHQMHPAVNVVSRSQKSEHRLRASDPIVQPKTPFAPAREAMLSRIEPGALGSIAVLIALTCALGYGAWSVLQQVQRVNVVPIEQAPTVAELDPLQGVLPVEVPEGEAGVTVSGVDVMDRLYRPRALDVPVLVARDGPISALNPDRVGTLSSSLSPPAPQFVAADTVSAVGETQVKVVAPDVPEVELFAVRPAWVRVTAPDGTVLFEKILDAGERYALPKTEEPPSLRAGNSGSLYFAVNGRTYGPAGPGGSVARQVVLAADSLQSVYRPADAEIDPDLIKFLRQPVD